MFAQKILKIEQKILTAYGVYALPLQQINHSAIINYKVVCVCFTDANYFF